MWVLDNKGTLIHMNQASRELFHVTDEEVIGKYNVFEDNIIGREGMMPLAKAVFEQGGEDGLPLTMTPPCFSQYVLKKPFRWSWK